jgi:hypothetical protein
MTSMRHELKLDRSGDGKYTGSGDVEMAGKWEATVTARRDGQEIGTCTITVEAK